MKDREYMRELVKEDQSKQIRPQADQSELSISEMNREDRRQTELTGNYQITSRRERE